MSEPRWWIILRREDEEGTCEVSHSLTDLTIIQSDPWVSATIIKNGVTRIEEALRSAEKARRIKVLASAAQKPGTVSFVGVSDDKPVELGRIEGVKLPDRGGHE